MNQEALKTLKEMMHLHRFIEVAETDPQYIAENKKAAADWSKTALK